MNWIAFAGAVVVDMISMHPATNVWLTAESTPGQKR